MSETLRRAHATKAEQAQLKFSPEPQSPTNTPKSTLNGSRQPTNLSRQRLRTPKRKRETSRGSRPTHAGAQASRAATRRKRGRRPGPGVGGGRSRPAQSCESLGASSHVSGGFPFSKLQAAPGPARGLPTERDPPRLRDAPPRRPNLPPREPRASGRRIPPRAGNRAFSLRACASPAAPAAGRSQE